MLCPVQPDAESFHSLSRCWCSYIPRSRSCDMRHALLDGHCATAFIWSLILRFWGEQRPQIRWDVINSGIFLSSSYCTSWCTGHHHLTAVTRWYIRIPVNHSVSLKMLHSKPFPSLAPILLHGWPLPPCRHGLFSYYFYNEKITAAANYWWCRQSPPKLLHTKKFMVRLRFLCSLSFHNSLW